MMCKRLINYIRERNIKSVAVIGMAKNSGKTVAFNTLVREGTLSGLKLALVSYGRDGEEIDSLTGKKKPRIKISADNVFVTAEEVFKASNIIAELINKGKHNTPFGLVNTYRAVEEGNIELVGVNSINHLASLKRDLPVCIDLILIDGALDRRSSAIPSLAEGIILSTGAVIANTEEEVVDKTLYEIKRLSIPLLKNKELRGLIKEFSEKGSNALIYNSRNCILNSDTSFSASKFLGKIKSPIDQTLETLIDNELKVIFLKGALVNSFAEELVKKYGVENCTIVVRDGTHVFLDNRRFNLLKKSNIKLQVLDVVNILGITVNPHNPNGLTLSSEKILGLLTEKLPRIPVFDVLSEKYLSLPLID